MRYMPLLTWVAIWAVRIVTGAVLALALAWFYSIAIAGWIDALPPPARLILLLGIPIWGFGCYSLAQVLSRERIAALVTHRDDGSLDLSPNDLKLVGGVVSVIVVALVLNQIPRAHEAPDYARVSVSGGQMVPLPYQEHWHGAGREMTLREARAIGAKPVIEDVDWDYATRGFSWLLATPESDWAVNFVVEE